MVSNNRIVEERLWSITDTLSVIRAAAEQQRVDLASQRELLLSQHEVLLSFQAAILQHLASFRELVVAFSAGDPSAMPRAAKEEAVPAMIAFSVKSTTIMMEPTISVELGTVHSNAMIGHNHLFSMEEQVRSLAPYLSTLPAEAERPPAEPPLGLVNLKEEHTTKLASGSGISTVPVVDDSTKSDSVSAMDSIGRIGIEKVGEKLLTVKDDSAGVFYPTFLKLHLILFSGENPRGWLHICASFLLGGRAIVWFTGFLTDKGIPWKEFGVAIVVVEAFKLTKQWSINLLLIAMALCFTEVDYISFCLRGLMEPKGAAGWCFCWKNKYVPGHHCHLRHLNSTEVVDGVEELGDSIQGVVELVESDLVEVDGDHLLRVLLDGVELSQDGSSYQGQSLLIKADGGSSCDMVLSVVWLLSYIQISINWKIFKLTLLKGNRIVEINGKMEVAIKGQDCELPIQETKQMFEKEDAKAVNCVLYVEVNCEVHVANSNVATDATDLLLQVLSNGQLVLKIDGIVDVHKLAILVISIQSRCGTSCRLWWLIYLWPKKKLENFSKEEDDLVIQLYSELGNNWSKFASRLPRRTKNEIKNHCHIHLKKSIKGKAKQRHLSIMEKDECSNGFREFVLYRIRTEGVEAESSVMRYPSHHDSILEEQLILSNKTPLVDSGSNFTKGGDTFPKLGWTFLDWSISSRQPRSF
ncbi:hypothetical protein Tsubulata_047297 [Turnera subulata]|uniref:Myb-like domain-containing protein n=1 Tax=Turnera subulata TaxID=218843 RepID=A0A9Q0IYK6_9ROSI|nr:hypothetical protein Tsubulata_047297 [Turnera subulata]